MADHSFGFETKMLHAGQIPDGDVGARAVPIYQTTSFVFEDADEAAHLFELKQYGNIYTRINNPTNAVLEERVAALEGGTGGVAFASGMAAQFATVMTLLSPGDEIVASSQLYGGTVTQMVHTLKKLGIAVKLVPAGDLPSWAEAVGPKTKLFFTETIGNPAGAIADLEGISQIAKSHKIVFAVDNTFATPFLCRPIEFGADIVTHSVTKFLGGHGSSIGGLVVDSGEFDYSSYETIAGASESYHGLKFFETFGHYGFLTKLRAETLRDTGACLSPFNAFLLLQGIETLSLRMERHVENSMGVAKFLEAHPKVERVYYAGLPSHPDYSLAQKYLPKGCGAVMSFDLKGGREAGRKFIEDLELFSHLANVGDAKSLVIHPASTTHQQLSDEELRRAGISPGMVRLSIGLETLSDIIWDLDQALEAKN